MGHHSTNGSWNIWEKTRCHYGTEGLKSLPDNRFCLFLGWKSGYQRIRKNRTLPRFGTRFEKDIEHENQGYTVSDRCHRSITHKVKKLVKGNRYWNWDNRVAGNCPPTHCSNLPKGSWGLRKLVTGHQEHNSTVKTVLHIPKKTLPI